MTIVTVNGVRGYYIFRAWITTKDGCRIYPKNGKKAFRIFVRL